MTLFPLDGSFIRLAARMVDPALGVAVGWNHFVSLGALLIYLRNSDIEYRHVQFAQTSYVIFECTVINTLVAYWGYNESPAILISASLVFYMAINIYRADIFGEAECMSFEYVPPFSQRSDPRCDSLQSGWPWVKSCSLSVSSFSHSSPWWEGTLRASESLVVCINRD